MNREVVKELIQGDMNSHNLRVELRKILSDEHREKLFEAYFELEEKLGGKGASENAARAIVADVKR